MEYQNVVPYQDTDSREPEVGKPTCWPIGYTGYRSCRYTNFYRRSSLFSNSPLPFRMSVGSSVLDTSNDSRFRFVDVISRNGWWGRSNGWLVVDSPSLSLSWMITSCNYRYSSISFYQLNISSCLSIGRVSLVRYRFWRWQCIVSRCYISWSSMVDSSLVECEIDMISLLDFSVK